MDPYGNIHKQKNANYTADFGSLYWQSTYFAFVKFISCETLMRNKKRTDKIVFREER